MKLNIGSSSSIRGIYKAREWINIDLVRPDKDKRFNYVVGSALELPFRNDSLDEIRMIHCLEHIKRSDHELFYKEAHRVLKPGADVFIEVPDLAGLCNAFLSIYNNKDDSKLIEKLRICTLSFYGKGRHYGDFHHWGFTKEQLSADLANNGFLVNIEKEMISNHFQYEPIILARGRKY